MIIDLRSTIRTHRGNPEVISPTARNNTGFLENVLGNNMEKHYLSRETVYKSGSRWGGGYPVPTASLMVQATHLAFDDHLGLTIRPDTLWYMITSQVAEYIKQNSSKYAYMFTDQPDEKKEIRVRDDSLVYGYPDNNWGNTIELFRNPLRAAVTDATADLFLAKFSTSTLEDDVTILVSFMDAASPFYKYTVETRCGITSIQLLGTREDYDLLVAKARQMAEAFPALAGYFRILVPVLIKIAGTFTALDQEFWSSFYRYKQESGIDLVTGWINTFQIFKQTKSGPIMKTDFNWVGNSWEVGVSIDGFTSHVSSVPFIWDYFGKLIPMRFIAGVIGVDYLEGHLDPRLGFGVFEEK